MRCKLCMLGNFACHFEDLTLRIFKLEDLKSSPDLLNNVKIGQDQLQLIMKYFFLWGLQHFGQVTKNNLMNTPSNSPVISEEKMFR